MTTLHIIRNLVREWENQEKTSIELACDIAALLSQEEKDEPVLVKCPLCDCASYITDNSSECPFCRKKVKFIPYKKEEKNECDYCQDNGFVYDKVKCPKCSPSLPEFEPKANGPCDTGLVYIGDCIKYVGKQLIEALNKLIIK